MLLCVDVFINKKCYYAGRYSEVDIPESKRYCKFQNSQEIESVEYDYRTKNDYLIKTK